MDLQEVFTSCELTCSTAYYKTSKYIQNFVIHCFNDNDYMDMWNKMEELHGSQAFGSCAIENLTQHIPNHCKTVLYSDFCSRKNCNTEMSLFLYWLFNDGAISAKITDHRFLVFGCSYFLSDSDCYYWLQGKTIAEHLYSWLSCIDIVSNAKKRNNILFKTTIQE
jgi:hypothetical protein